MRSHLKWRKKWPNVLSCVFLPFSLNNIKFLKLVFMLWQQCDATLDVTVSKKCNDKLKVCLSLYTSNFFTSGVILQNQLFRRQTKKFCCPKTWPGMDFFRCNIMKTQTAYLNQGVSSSKRNDTENLLYPDVSVPVAKHLGSEKCAYRFIN